MCRDCRVGATALLRLNHPHAHKTMVKLTNAFEMCNARLPRIPPGTKKHTMRAICLFVNHLDGCEWSVFSLASFNEMLQQFAHISLSHTCLLHIVLVQRQINLDFRRQVNWKSEVLKITLRWAQWRCKQVEIICRPMATRSFWVLTHARPMQMIESHAKLPISKYLCQFMRVPLFQCHYSSRNRLISRLCLAESARNTH